MLAALLVAGCNSPYKNLRWIGEQDSHSVDGGHQGHHRQLYKPEFTKELYRAQVNGRFLLKNYHLSGLLFFKQLEHEKRVVFQNEMGYSFFDFGWDQNDSFTVHSIIPQLNKKPLIRLLQKDFTLLLGLGLDPTKEELSSKKDGGIYTRYPLTKGYAYYISDNAAAQVFTRFEAGDARPVITIYPFWNGAVYSMLPDSMAVLHHKAHFTITAKIINDDAATE